MLRNIIDAPLEGTDFSVTRADAGMTKPVPFRDEGFVSIAEIGVVSAMGRGGRSDAQAAGGFNPNSDRSQADRLPAFFNTP